MNSTEAINMIPNIALLALLFVEILIFGIPNLQIKKLSKLRKST